MLDEQKSTCLQRQHNLIPDTVYILEHNPVITQGARQSENKLLTQPEALEKLGIKLVSVGRGGGTTAHNPGQLVIYPIIHLKQRNLGINDYIRQLEAIGIELLEKFSITAKRKKGSPGLWIKNQKIASIGVKVKKWVTYHGMAVNIQNDLSIFEHMIPCGLENVSMTSIKKQTKKADIKKAKTYLARICKKYWEKQ
jgi:lipoyl(octanoyl) transferase